MPKVTGAPSASVLTTRNKAAIKKAAPLLDSISNSWEKFEELFRNQGILRSACFAYDVDQTGQYLLGVDKINGAWRICYAYENNQARDEDIQWRPVADAPTALRIQLLDHVPGLHEAIVKSNEKYIVLIDEAAAKSQKILEDLEFSDLF